MTHKRTRIGIVDPDIESAGMVADHLTRCLGVEAVCSQTEFQALEHDRVRRYDLVLANLDLREGDALHLAGQLQTYGSRPVILVSDQPALGRVIEALRIGVKDLLIRPFDLLHLSRVVRNALDVHEHELRQQLRTRRLRKACRQLERDRGELQQRIELVCRDLVSAYGRLAERVVALQSASENVAQS